ncbi:hypothetical protein RM530_14590 [Algiphilus sp. W345]|uniref:5'-methylthioadenosine/S-adenosylhomocysteine nucleosidase n=1 Tax=Banduia mediterranea TaxID=3075609 RepID=A0ABU2WL09_9GAMM|nr:hypothetical protein [Algiphilus sp. W345]MDT0498576.1 hypothetical protein [Algiphilus sp. W345]
MLAGSVSLSARSENVKRAHEFVRAFVAAVLEAGDGFVVYVAAEAFNEAGEPVLFDWSVLRQIDALLPGEAEVPRAVVVLSEKGRIEKMSPEQRGLIGSMAGRRLIEISTIPDDVVTGGNIVEAQIDRAAGMIALGGGKGVSDRAYKMMKLGRPVYPLDLKIGALGEDGHGAAALHRAFMNGPLSYFSHTGEAARTSSLALSLEEPGQPIPDIAAKIAKLIRAEIQAQELAAPTDVLILTALPIELSASLDAFEIDDETPAAKTEIGQNYFRARVVSATGKSVICTIASFGTAGNVDAAAATASLLAEFKPKSVVMLGIAAGMRDKCALGDVVISDRIVAYEGAALLAGGDVASRPETFRLGLPIQQDVTLYLARGDALKRRLDQAWARQGLALPASSQAGVVSNDIRPKPATIASGEKLLRDPDKFRQLREIQGKIEVAEMEAVGVFTACQQHGTPALIIRGISDYGDETKDNTFHELAAKAAAVATADFVANGLTT